MKPNRTDNPLTESGKKLTTSRRKKDFESQIVDSGQACPTQREDAPKSGLRPLIKNLGMMEPKENGITQNPKDMKRLTRNILIVFGLTALVLLAIAFWTARIAWISSENLSTDYAEKIFKKDDFLDDASAGLLRMNNLLVMQHIRPEQASELRQQFESQSAKLRRGMNSEESILPEIVKKRVVIRIREDFESYLESANAFLNAKHAETNLENQIERIQLIREKTERLLISLKDLSDRRSEILQESFVQYKTTQSKLIWLALFLSALSFLLIGASAIILLRNRSTKLRLELSQAKIAQQKQEKLASLGTLASGVAHEIRNPLTAIKARLFTLEKKINPESEAILQVNEIGNEINRLERIVKEFLLFARPPKPEAKNFDLAPFLEQVSDFLQPELSEKSIRLAIEPSQPLFASGDVEHLKQILINLIQNAADASNPNDTITLHARNLNSRNANQIAIDVIDQGSGVPEEVAKKLFNPFYTTKPKGSGLGLSIAKRIAQAHHGDLTFVSAPGEGTTFTLTLPAAKAA